MRKRRTDPVMQKLRRLVHYGRRSEAATLLEETLRTNPSHSRAREELSRYLTNRPFTFEEAEHEELKKILTNFLASPQDVTSMSKGAAKRLRKRVAHLQHSHEHLLTTSEKNTLQQLRKAISRVLQRHRKPAHGVIVAVFSALGLLLAGTGAGFYLWSSSEKAADELEKAADQQLQSKHALNMLQIHDTGLNRTINRRVGFAADRLRASLAARKQRSRELDALLKRIESGEQTVVGQGVRRRAEIERRLRDLGEDAMPLRNRWAELCRREQKELNQQRISLAEELMAPLPPGEQLSGNLAEDIQRLQERRKVLLQRQSIFDDAGATLELPETLILPVQNELKQVNAQLNDITQLKNQLELLPAVRDYKQFRSQLEAMQSEHYVHGAELLETRRYIPKVSTLRGMMQEHGQNIPADLLQAARKSLIEGGPSFSTEFPATKEQLHLLDELLTNTALRTRLIELTNNGKEQAFSEEPPVLRNGRVYFKRSTLDPNYDAASSNKIEWLEPREVWQRVLDPRPIYRKLHLDNRTGFASRVNIPQLITTVMTMNDADVPVLARAYVLHNLLKINSLSSHEMLSGMRFAPEMREAVASFEKIREKCGIELSGDCWHKNNMLLGQEEELYARWFRKHRKLDFAAELRQNLGSLLRITPRFCGYVNEHCSAVLFEEPRKGQLIWYLSGSTMTTTPWGKDMQAPRPLSPIFSMEKAY